MKRSALPVGAWPAGLDPKLFQLQLAQRLAVAVGGVAGAVVGHHSADADAPVGEPGDAALEEGDCAGGGEVVEHLGVRDPGVVVDHHVQELVTRETGLPSVDAAAVLALPVSEHAMAGTTDGDTSQPLDVDVDELAGVPSLVPVRRLGRRKPRALPQPDPPQPHRDRRQRQLEHLGDLGRRHPQPPQALDRPHPLARQPRRTPPRPRRAVDQVTVAIPKAAQPLRRRANAATRGLSRLPLCPTLLKHTPTDQQPATRTGPMVSVQLHPAPSLELVASTPPASKEARMNNLLRNYT